MAWAQDRWNRYGPVSWCSVFGTQLVTALGPDATQQILANRDKVFSNARGWEYFIGPFFRRGLMLLDGEEHLHDRRIMQAAFSRDRLGSYLAQMQPPLEATIGGLHEGRLLAYPMLKQLTLDLATHVFLGIDLGAAGRRAHHRVRRHRARGHGAGARRRAADEVAAGSARAVASSRPSSARSSSPSAPPPATTSSPRCASSRTTRATASPTTTSSTT